MLHFVTSAFCLLPSDFCPIPPLMPRPDRDADDDQDQQSPLLDVGGATEDAFNRAAEVEPRRRDDDRPHDASDRFVDQKLDHRNTRDADDHGTCDAQAIKPLRDENRRSAVALEDANALSEVPLHLRKPVEQLHSFGATEPEPENMADIVAGSGHRDHPHQLQVSPLGKEAGHDQDRLALEKRPDENGDVPELVEEKLWRHSGPKMQDPGLVEINDPQGA